MNWSKHLGGGSIFTLVKNHHMKICFSHMKLTGLLDIILQMNLVEVGNLRFPAPDCQIISTLIS
jgi:hypothetical protein